MVSSWACRLWRSRCDKCCGRICSRFRGLWELGTDIAWGARADPNRGWDVVAFTLIEESSGTSAVAKSRAEEEEGVADIGIEEAEAEAVDVVGAVLVFNES